MKLELIICELMKHTPLYSLFIICYLLFIPAAAAQPSWTKKASKAVFTLKTFDAKGAPVGTATGFYVGSDGEALSAYAPFKGAARALIVDASGKEHAVSAILGASDTYDVARFRVDASKTQPLAVAAAVAPTGTRLWLLPWRETKALREATVAKTETIRQHYGYYTLSLGHSVPGGSPAGTEGIAGTPLLDDDGRVVGIMQQPYKTDGEGTAYAGGALFADSLRISGLSINDPALRAIGIKKALPDDQSQALLTLYVAAAQLDSAAYATLIDDFIAQFPKSHEGYVTRAQFAANADRCDAADRDMAEALRTGSHTDDVHYSYSKLILQKLLSRPEPPYAPWTLDRALSEAEAAYADSPQPVYRQQQAVVLMAQQRYDEAYTAYEQLFASPLRSPEVFFDASRCKVLAGDTAAQIALLDSCVALFSRPYLKEAAPYLLVAAQARIDAGRYREAVPLLTDYEQLMAAQVNDRFYYLRFQAEVSGKLFQQALNDIDRAIAISPQSDLYYAEKASLLVRLGLYDETIATAQEAIAIAPDHSDGYLFLGLAQCLKGDKAQGRQNLEKARDMGDPQADALIAKYAY